MKWIAPCLFAFAFMLVIAQGAYAQGGASSARAANLLRATIEASQKTRMSAIQVRRPSANAESVQVQIEMSGTGRSRMQTLQPMCMQGIVTIDNGVTMYTFSNDRNLALSHPSPQSLEPSLEKRMGRVLSNYNLRIVGSARVAGRTGTVLIAEPKSESMPARRFIVDDKYKALLQADLIFGNQTTTQLETISINFNPNIRPERFEAKALEAKSPTRIKAPSPQPVTGEATRIGFRPITPKPLPFGFEVDSRHMVRIGTSNVMAYRLSDGLAYVTVYQWKANEKLAPSQSGPQDRLRNGVHLRLMGDLPEPVMRRILEAFRSQAQEGPLFLVLELDQEILLFVRSAT